MTASGHGTKQLNPYRLRFVRALQDTLAEQIGRPAAVRVSNNAPDYVRVFDPVLTAVDRSMNMGRIGYQVGYCIDFANGRVGFENGNSPGLIRVLRKNLIENPKVLMDVLSATKRFRHDHRMAWDSRAELSETNEKSFTRFIPEFDDERLTWAQFRRAVENEFAPQDLNPSCPPGGIIDRLVAPLRGCMLWVALASVAELRKDDLDANLRAFVRASWPLFSMLYPHGYTSSRSANLRRNLMAVVSPRVCEAHLIRGLPKHLARCEPHRCKDLHAAHIIPHCRYGSDRPENGLWLCPFHARETEDRLAGKRRPDDLSQVEVNYQRAAKVS